MLFLTGIFVLLFLERESYSSKNYHGREKIQDACKTFLLI